MRRNLVERHLDEVAALRTAAIDKIFGEIKIPLLVGKDEKPHERLKKRGGLHMVRTPSLIAHIHLRRRPHLRDDRIRLPLERCEKS